MRSAKSVVLGVLIFAALIIVAPAQENTITLSGTVTDPTNAAIPGVEIKIRVEKCKCSDCKNPTRCDCCPDQETQTTNNSGSYSFTLPHGIYRIEATAGSRQAHVDVDLSEGSTKIQNFRVRDQDIQVE